VIATKLSRGARASRALRRLATVSCRAEVGRPVLDGARLRCALGMLSHRAHVSRSTEPIVADVPRRRPRSPAQLWSCSAGSPRAQINNVCCAYSRARRPLLLGKRQPARSPISRLVSTTSRNWPIAAVRGSKLRLDK
jgi:hypothetical protein